jgi:hypothetical protein
MIRHTTALALILGCSAALIGCGQDSPPAAATPTHNHEHDHHDDGHHHAGPKHDLGRQSVGPFNVSVTQVGNVKAGSPATFEIVLIETAPTPSAVRAWVGNEQAVGSVKVRAVQRPAFFDADLEVPAELPEGARLWVEIELDNAARHVGSFEYHR